MYEIIISLAVSLRHIRNKFYSTHHHMSYLSNFRSLMGNADHMLSDLKHFDHPAWTIRPTRCLAAYTQ